MKYVFGVSSHLSFYLCHKIVETDLLNPDNCIFFFTRNYHCPTKYDTIYKNIIDTDYNVSTNSGRVFEGLNFIKTKRNIRQFDALVDAYIKGDEFLWYSQICNNDFCSLFVTKTNCKGYYVIEDGVGSYREINPQTFTGWKSLLYKLILKPIWKRCFEVKNFFITTDHPKFKGCIATTEQCFPLHKKYLRCVGLPFEKIDLGFTPDALISIDPLYLWMKEQHEEKVHQELSKHIKAKKYRCVAYKFHPYFNAKANANIKKRYIEIINKFYDNVPLYELDSVIAIENVLITYQCDFYTDNSSVAIYASQAGSKCYSYIPIIKHYAKENISIHKGYPNIPILEKVLIPIEVEHSRNNH